MLALRRVYLKEPPFSARWVQPLQLVGTDIVHQFLKIDEWDGWKPCVSGDTRRVLICTYISRWDIDNGFIGQLLYAWYYNRSSKVHRRCFRFKLHKRFPVNPLLIVNTRYDYILGGETRKAAIASKRMTHININIVAVEVSKRFGLYEPVTGSACFSIVTVPVRYLFGPGLDPLDKAL